MALCCEEKKEFCVLVAVCMRQMITRLKQEKPKKISVELTKKVVKRTAEERALEMQDNYLLNFGQARGIIMMM